MSVSKVKYTMLEGGAATLSIESENAPETLQRNLDKIKILCEALLDSEKYIDTISEELPTNRLRAILAIRMKADYHLAQAKTMLEGTSAISTGKKNAADYGFPEFDDKSTEEPYS